jgi:hypothetical protein
MSQIRALLVGALLLASSAALAPGADATVDAEGFIVDWLMLAPFSIPEESGGDEIDKQQIAKEGDLRPKAGDTQKVGDKQGTWKAVKAKEYDLDFNEALGTQNEDVVGYLAAYVVADKDMPGLTAAIGSNDQAKLWLNGKELYKFAETRTIDRDSDKVQGVTLAKGVNAIVFKVINQKNSWAAALRFLDKDGKPVTGLVVKTAP